MITAAQKEVIDSLSYHALLQAVRFAPAGDPRFQGEHGAYWMQRLAEKRAEVGADRAAAVSKALG